MKRFNGQEVVYDGWNFILTLVKKGKEDEPIFIGCTDFSISDPIICFQKHMYENCTELAFYFKGDSPLYKKWDEREGKIWEEHHDWFGCQGLEETGKEFAEFLNNLDSPIVLEFLCKSALMLDLGTYRNTLRKNVKISYSKLSVPFLGTSVVMEEVTKSALNKFEFWMSEKFSSHHIIDNEIRKDSRLLKVLLPREGQYYSSTLNLNTDVHYLYRLKDKIRAMINPVNFFFCFLGRKLEKYEGVTDSNGLVTLESQEYLTDCIRVYSSIAKIFTHPIIKNDVQKEIDYFQYQ